MHVHDPVVPPIVPYSAEQWSAPSLPSLVESEEAAQSLGLHTVVSLRVPTLHDLCPDKVYPVLQFGVHDDPCARVEVQPGPAAPLEMAPDASHGLALHTAVSLRVPSVHDLVPERV